MSTAYQPIFLSPLLLEDGNTVRSKVSLFVKIERHSKSVRPFDLQYTIIERCARDMLNTKSV
jgi:hypothetical protein